MSANPIEISRPSFLGGLSRISRSAPSPEAASGLKPPTEVKLKPKSEFTLIGKPHKREDTPSPWSRTRRGTCARLAMP